MTAALRANPRRTSTSPRLPPGPRMPAVLQATAWVFRPVPFLEACRRRFGTTFTLSLAGLPPMVVFADPADVKQILGGDPAVFLAGRANQALKPTTWLRSFGPRSLLLLDGARHGAERKLMMPALHGERMHTYRRVMRECADAAVSRWPVGTFALYPEMQALTLEIMLKTIFGLEDGQRKQALGHALVEMLDIGEHQSLVFFAGAGGAPRGRALVEDVLHLPGWARFEGKVARVDSLLLDEIGRRRAKSDRTHSDVLSLLLEARDEAGRSLDDASLLDEMKTLLIAGFETTATALTWTMFELLRAPDVLARLRHELEHGDDYLDAVLWEALRLHAVVPILARQLAAGADIGGRRYTAGTLVAPSLHLAHRDPAFWPDPARFDPGRFAGGTTPELMPFGIGPRRCLGMAFALFQMRTVLRQIVARTRLRLAPGYHARAVRRGISFAIAEGLPVTREQ